MVTVYCSSAPLVSASASLPHRMLSPNKDTWEFGVLGLVHLLKEQLQGQFRDLLFRTPPCPFDHFSHPPCPAEDTVQPSCPAEDFSPLPAQLRTFFHSQSELATLITRPSDLSVLIASPCWPMLPPLALLQLSFPTYPQSSISPRV